MGTPFCRPYASKYLTRVQCNGCLMPASRFKYQNPKRETSSNDQN
jgi:hypothetical protein